jgi:dipeptidase E
MQVAFADIGIPEATSLHRFDDAGASGYLAKVDAIWVGGGETFVLLAELYRTGQLAIIRERVLAGVPFGGSSAGANVAGLLIGTTNDFPTAEVPTREALAIFPAVINPHHPTPETKADYDGRVGKILTYRKFNPGESVIGLANAAMVRLHAGKITVPNGAVWLYAGNGQQELKPGADVTELVLAKSAAK